MREGLDTTLGERGVRLSGGQRQRIGIARALYHNPDLIVFDEATSSLDVKTEEEVTSAIRSMKGQRTIIVIAHRLSTVKNCDRLVYLRDARLVDSGSFAELAQRNPDFAETVALSTRLEVA
jgi:ATP-binding cassette subfamily C protein